MKISRKYATVAFLLVAMATIIPVHVNSSIKDQAKEEEVLVEPKKTEIPWYKTPKGRKDFAEGMVAIAGLVLWFYIFDLYVDAKMRPRNF